MFPKRAKQLYAQKSDFSLHMSMESQAFSNLWLFKDQTAPKHIGSYPQKGTQQQQQQTQTPPTTTNNHHWIIYPNYLQKKTQKLTSKNSRESNLHRFAESLTHRLDNTPRNSESKFQLFISSPSSFGVLFLGVKNL